MTAHSAPYNAHSTLCSAFSALYSALIDSARYPASEEGVKRGVKSMQVNSSSIPLFVFWTITLPSDWSWVNPSHLIGPGVIHLPAAINPNMRRPWRSASSASQLYCANYRHFAGRRYLQRADKDKAGCSHDILQSHSYPNKIKTCKLRRPR